ncbi:MAG: mercury(II) reductase [Candidatus Heimdallarchaeum aukensis]|uniref:Mercuric reductase n=1 Tax=Candidatus Heimdallarchaeum aukensis TaxID=2876573 RepID=A0A9Y1FKJ4_9ARCH|nr:MAG: mercury(II) reductase [Candidatus Heimdallarchaeum aukensis]
MEEKIELEIQGMSCASCELHVKKALSKLDGINNVHVSKWEEGKAEVITSKIINDETIKTSIENIGYKLKKIKRVKIFSDEINKVRNADFDIAVIGTGGAGVAAAIKTAELGKNVVIIEKGTIGGTCVNIGCVPSKTLIKVAGFKHKLQYNPIQGLTADIKEFNWQKVISQKNALINELRKDKYINVLNSYKERIKLIQGKAEIIGKNSIKIDNKHIIKVEKIIIATGAKPKNLSILEKKGVDVLTSTTAMQLKSLPKSLIILGGRAIALELGQMFHRLGVKVTILQRSSTIIPVHEPELSHEITEILKKEGLRIFTSVKIVDAYQQKEEKSIIAKINGKKREFKAEEIMVALGRTPNTKELGLKNIGLKTDKDGFIVVNNHLQTNIDNIYAAGDVTTLPKFVYVAAASGGIAAENAVKGNIKKIDLSTLPSVIFTDPQIATVGLTEKQAIDQGYKVKTSLLPMKYVPHALTSFDTRGFVKLIADKETDYLIGAHIITVNAGEIIQTASLIISFGKKYGVTLTDITTEFFPYLVQVEAIKLAILALDKDVEKLSCCAN